ncbi:hypothetical protein [Frigoribacterium sp. UYMn621]|uniref:hypothetical protein n=1 Tax=Frigoribacterium sp. UYMn621 TaxID=3156343 RepID=UPI0033962C2B
MASEFDGFVEELAEAMRERGRGWARTSYQNNRLFRIASASDYVRDNPITTRERRKVYYDRGKAKLSLLARSRYRSNPSPYLERAAVHRREHPDKVIAYRVAYFAKNKERIRAKNRANWRLTYVHKGRPAGESHVEAKLTELAVIDIRLRAAKGEPRLTLMKEYEVSKTLIGNIIRRTAWKHVA